MNALSVLFTVLVVAPTGDKGSASSSRPNAASQPNVGSAGSAGNIGAGSSRPSGSPSVSSPRPTPQISSPPRMESPRVSPPVPRSNGDLGSSTRVINRPPVTNPNPGDVPRRVITTRPPAGNDRGMNGDRGIDTGATRGGGTDPRSRSTVDRRNRDVPDTGNDDRDRGGIGRNRDRGGVDDPNPRDRGGLADGDLLGSSRNPYVLPRPRSGGDTPPSGGASSTDTERRQPRRLDPDRGGGDGPPPGDDGDATDESSSHHGNRNDSRDWHSNSRDWHGDGSWCNCWSWWSTGTCWHHWHFGTDPWFCCGNWFGWSWGYVFCGDAWSPWVWYCRPRYGSAVYVYYPYPYPSYSYVYLDYVDEAKTYPPLPSETYIDSASDLDRLIEQGRQLFKQGDYLGAAEAFRQAILKDLNNAVAKFGYAHALFALGNYPFAALAIRLGMKLVPEWPIIGGGLRELYGKQGDLEAQLKALDQFLAQRPDDPAALLVAGYVCYFSGDLDRAASAFERLAQKDPNDEVARRFVDAANAIKMGQPLAPSEPTVPAPGQQDH